MINPSTNRFKLFIGHANPEDNEFSLWLSSRLINEGYEVFCDMKNLLGGEQDFWETIQSAIANDSVKYLLVLSKNTFKKPGVKDEWEYAKGIARKHDLIDFIVPLRIDDVAHDERIGLNRINIIEFNESWKEGLMKLLKKLESENIPKVATQDSISNLLKDSIGIYNSLNKNKEKYFTNILPIFDLPENIYIFKYHHESGAKAVRKECIDFPISLNGNTIYSFEKDIPTILTKSDHIEIKPQDKFLIKIQDILLENQILMKFEIGNPLNCLKTLLRNSFRNYLFGKGLLKFVMANNNFCYYYKINTIENNKVTFGYESKKKTKNLIGKYRKKFLNQVGEYEKKEYQWHFGISFKVMTIPFLSYVIKSHVLFSENGETIWDNESKMHAARRDKCKMWHNQEWRDILLAFLNSLGNENQILNISVTKNKFINISFLPTLLSSEVGYTDPSDSERRYLLRNNSEEEFSDNVTIDDESE